ncbi:hypothetical protein D3C85_1816480 [compost metagenome]
MMLAMQAKGIPSDPYQLLNTIVRRGQKDKRLARISVSRCSTKPLSVEHSKTVTAA